jgi:hypothetical protein
MEDTVIMKFNMGFNNYGEQFAKINETDSIEKRIKICTDIAANLETRIENIESSMFDLNLLFVPYSFYCR